MDESRNLIFVCDGTLASQRPGEETSALLLYRTLEAAGASARQHFHYDAGIQSRVKMRTTATIAIPFACRFFCRRFPTSTATPSSAPWRA